MSLTHCKPAFIILNASFVDDDVDVVLTAPCPSDGAAVAWLIYISTSRVGDGAEATEDPSELEPDKRPCWGSCRC